MCDTDTLVTVTSGTTKKGELEMPSTARILKEEIITAAYDITKEQGMEAMTTRAISQRLKCSVKPIYYAFENMDNLREAVLAKTMQKYTSILTADIHGVPKVYQIGLNYVRFAREYPHLFRFIFCTDRQENTSIVHSCLDENRPLVIKRMQEGWGVTQAQATDIYVKTGVFCHGIASMIISKTAKFEDSDVYRLIKEVSESIVSDVRSGCSSA